MRLEVGVSIDINVEVKKNLTRHRFLNFLDLRKSGLWSYKRLNQGDKKVKFFIGMKQYCFVLNSIKTMLF